MTGVQTCALPISTNCWAVGWVQIGSVNRPLIVRWNGTAWSLGNAPAIDNGTLASVSCTAATNCWAVGAIQPGAGTPTRLVLRWNGSTWTQVSTALPAGTTSSELKDVACTGATACWAVGEFTGTNPSRRLVLRWNGTTWSPVVTALPSGAGESTANSVACGSATSCVIAGGAFLSGAPRRMVLRWNGTTWAVETLPAEPANSEASLLFGASCSSATNCVVTGATAVSIDVIRRFDLGRLVSATYPLDDYTHAIAHAASAGRRGAVKIAFDLRPAGRSSRSN